MAKDFTRYPIRSIFEDQLEPVLVKGAYNSFAAATANQLVITAVTGKKIRVVSLNMTNLGAQNSLFFMSASGGTVLDFYTIPVNTVATPNVTLPFDPAGHFETASGQGLYLTTNAGGAVQVRVRYIEVP